MNIYSKLLLGAAALSFAACSSEEPMGAGNGQNPDVIKPTGDVAYLSVCLQSADDSRSRANDNYLYGLSSENAVKNAYFYFYDDKGEFVLQSNTWLGGDATKNPGDVTEDGNIEFKGKTTIVLTGLTGKDYPSYVVTVLNKPENFEPATSLAGMGQALINSYSNGEVDDKGDETFFTMTTSSFFGGVNPETPDDFTYFTTKLKPTDFQETGKPSADATTVDIYVERLAARVEVRVDLKENKKLEGVQYLKKYDLYELPVSVAGEENPEIGSNTAATNVYVAIIGWQLNSTAKQTYLMKNLEDWKLGNEIGGSSDWWNKSDHHRSFWAKSTNYGKSADALTASLNENNYSWNELDKEVSTARFNGDRVYCNETTNIPANIVKNGQVFSQYTPSVVLAAVVCDKNGNALDLVTYQGVEYLKESFIKRILSYANTTKYYIKNGNDYDQIDVKDVDIESASDLGLGCVKVGVKDKAATYYKLTPGATKDENGNYDDDDFQVATVAEIDAHFAQYSDATNKAVAKNDGAMYYTIPLAHLNKSTDGNIVEGQYGLVRNHVYDLTITKIKTLGDGVFDPDSEHVNPEEPKDPTYYVESAINILSWKIVSQEVEI